MPELSDLPVFIQRMIAERCDFLSRFNLRSSSRSMKEVVDQSKFIIESVELYDRDLRSLEMYFKYRNRDGNTKEYTIKLEIGNADLMEKTAKWMATILNNSEIGSFHFFTRLGGIPEDLIEDLAERVKDNLKSPLKAQDIFCESKIDPFWIFDKSYCQLLTCRHEDPNFFQWHSDTLKKMEFVWLSETMNITDEDVISMKAEYIDLKSENFSAETVNQLVDKFIARGLIDSEFRLNNPKGNFIPEIKIPDGFIASTVIRGFHEKIEGDKKMKLSVEKDVVSFEISRLRRTNNE